MDKSNKKLGTKLFTPNTRKSTPLGGLVPPKLPSSSRKRIPLYESPEERRDRLLHQSSEFSREQQQRESDTANMYIKLKLVNMKLKSMINALGSVTSELISDDEQDDDDIDISFLNESLADEFDFFDLKNTKDDKYIFYSQDPTGNKMQRKTLKWNGKEPFAIEINVKDYHPEDIHIDSNENRIVISMSHGIYYKGSEKIKPRIFGISCPTVDAVDKLKIHYPKNGILRFEGETQD